VTFSPTSGDFVARDGSDDTRAFGVWALSLSVCESKRAHVDLGGGRFLSRSSSSSRSRPTKLESETGR